MYGMARPPQNKVNVTRPWTEPDEAIPVVATFRWRTAS
jgi:hypothetical protein